MIGQYYLFENGACVGISNDPDCILKWMEKNGNFSVISCDRLERL